MARVGERFALEVLLQMLSKPLLMGPTDGRIGKVCPVAGFGVGSHSSGGLGVCSLLEIGRGSPTAPKLPAELLSGSESLTAGTIGSESQTRMGFSSFLSALVQNATARKIGRETQPTEGEQRVYVP